MKILLITDVPPCKEFSGALLTEQLCKFIPEYEIDAFVIINKALKGMSFSSGLKNVNITWFNKPRENIGHVNVYRSGKVISIIYEWYVQFFIIRRLLKQIEKAGSGKNYCFVWCILQGQTIIRIALPAARKMKAKLLTQVWDHPSWWFSENKVSDHWKNIFMDMFARTLKHSWRCASASYAMTELFNSLYNIDSFPLMAGVDKEKIKLPSDSINEKTVVIGVAGQLYAQKGWSSFLDAIDSINWEINGKRIIIKILGYHFEISGHRKVNIEFLGYRSQDETIDILSDCDILYCPYFFDKKNEIISMTSFPSKLVTYLASGRPVFFHGPENSSPAKLLSKFNAGILCYELNREIIISRFKEIINNKMMYKQITSNGYNMINELLTTEILRRNFFQFINLE